MLVVVGVVIGEAAVAYVVLDLLFRYMSVEPHGLRERLRRYGLGYGCLAVACSAAGMLAQYRLAGAFGAGVGLLNAVPWWLLWRFGLRKQLTFLFKADGGQPVETERPDP